MTPLRGTVGPSSTRIPSTPLRGTDVTSSTLASPETGVSPSVLCIWIKLAFGATGALSILETGPLLQSLPRHWICTWGAVVGLGDATVVVVDVVVTSADFVSFTF